MNRLSSREKNAKNICSTLGSFRWPSFFSRFFSYRGACSQAIRSKCSIRMLGILQPPTISRTLGKQKIVQDRESLRTNNSVTQLAGVTSSEGDKFQFVHSGGFQKNEVGDSGGLQYFRIYKVTKPVKKNPLN